MFNRFKSSLILLASYQNKKKKSSQLTVNIKIKNIIDKIVKFKIQKQNKRYKNYQYRRVLYKKY